MRTSNRCFGHGHIQAEDLRIFHCCASVHGCFGGGSPCDGFSGSAYTKREGAYFCIRRGAQENPGIKRERGLLCICVESKNLT